MSRINYKYIGKYALYIFLFSIFLNLLLFIPALTQSHGGAGRWIDLGFITFQPSEFLKIAFVIYFAAWLAGVKDKVTSFSLGILPYIIIIGVLSSLLIIERTAPARTHAAATQAAGRTGCTRRTRLTEW